MTANKKMKPLDGGRLKQLILGQRWAALGTTANESAQLSWVAYAVDEQGGVLLHLSRLAQHTRNMQETNAAVLSVSEHDDGACDPQTLARVTLDGTVSVIDRGGADYASAKTCYLKRLPNAEMLFEFEDFTLFRFQPNSAHYVEGFGSTHRLTADKLQTILFS